jgi:hypothetical protein
MFEFESPTNLMLGLITGIGFGFLLQKGRVAKYQTILGQLLLKDWSVERVQFNIQRKALVLPRFTRRAIIDAVRYKIVAFCRPA